MSQLPTPANVDIDPEETREWIEALESVVKSQGGERAQYLLAQLSSLAGGAAAQTLSTPYRNTIPKSEEPHYPGNLSIEHKLRGLVRWNALAMVMKANKKSDGIGGHISSFASSATLYEVGYNHFFKGPNGSKRGDVLFSQGHVAPGIYSRAFVEGRLSEEKIHNFRRELAKGGGLSSYPHPRLMPEFWQFPTVSMGLGPIMSMYLARYYKYATARNLADATDSRVWAYLGDGELDEPEALGNITFASREGLDNLTWVVNCNLQRLDGPVRGNASVIQETEALFRGAGWNVIKVIWGSNWDELFAADKTGALDRLFAKTVDGEYQRLAVASGADNRQKFFAKDPEALRLVEHLSDRQLELLRRGGHDLAKVYAAYHKAVNTRNGKPTVIIAKTIKGYLMGESGEAKNAAHQTKKVEFDALKKLVARYQLPLNDQEIEDLKFLPVEKGSPEAEYLKQVRQKLGDFIPQRVDSCPAPAMPRESFWEVYAKGTTGKPISTTMAYVRILSALMGSKEFGKLVVPIIPDEARTFGMEGLYRQYGIYSVKGQLYDPPDKESLTPYREVVNGQIFQEGINEAGSMASFIAAGTAYSHLGVPTLPFYQYYSMFGFQRIGDLVWAAADCKCRGFLMGGTAGRTTLNGEGLQHEDGHSHILASTVPNLQCYDPAYMYEMAVVLKDGIERMQVKGEDVFYYVTMYNENYDHPDMPKGVEEGIRRGLYKFRKSAVGGKAPKVHLMTSGVTMRHVLSAADMLEEKYGLSVDVWSAPSFKRLREETLLAERWNRLHPTAKPKSSWLLDTLKDEKGVFVAATDYMRAWPDMIGPWVPGGLLSLGTDGFGMSESREELRRYFEVDTPHIVQATLAELARKGQIKPDVAAKAITDLGIDPEKPHGLHPL